MASGATELGVAYLTILPSMQGFNRRINAQVSTAGKGAGKVFGGLFSAFAGGAITAAVGLIAAKAVRGIKESISAASALTEVQNKVNVVFGKQGAKALEKWSKGAANAFGQSQRGALQAAANFAIFGKSAGLSGGNLVSFSKKFTVLASDLASFHDTSPEEAILAIGAAFRGEMEPIRKYGVLLDDASLRQEAVRQGLIKTTKTALTPQQKVLAAQGLILKQTSDAQGDYARTADSYANAQRRFNAQVEDSKAKWGNLFLPIATKVFKFLNDKFLPVIADKIIPAFEDFFKKIGKDKKLKEALKHLEDALKGITDKDFAGTLDAVAKALPGIAENMAKAAEAVGEFYDAIVAVNKIIGKEARGGMFDGKGPLGFITIWFKDMWHEMSTSFMRDNGEILNDFKGFISGVANGFTGLVSRAVAGAKRMWTDVKTTFVTGHTEVINDVKGFASGVATWFVNLKNRAVAGAGRMWADVTSSFIKGHTEVVNDVIGFKNRVVGFFANLGTGIKTASTNMWASVVKTWTDRTTKVKNTVSGWRDKILQIGRDLKTKLFNSIDTMLTDIKDRFTRGVDAIGRAWDALKAKAKAPIEFIVTTVLNKGLIPAFNAVAKVLPGVTPLDLVTLKWAKGTSRVLPGYTPGRDVHRFYSATGGVLDLSGGEGVAVPQLVRAVGRRRWDMANKAARTGRRDDAMHYLGGYAKGASGIDATKAYARSIGLGSGSTYPGHGELGSNLSWDFMTGSNSQTSKGNQLANWAWANARAISLWYEIYYRRIRSMTRPSAGWTPYTRYGSGASPSQAHLNHVHLSFYRSALGGVKSGLVGAGSGGGGGFSVIDYVKQLKDKMAGGLKDLASLGGTPWEQMLKGMVGKIKDGMIEKIKKAMEALAAAATTQGMAGGKFTAAGGGSNRAIGHRMMLQRWGENNWPALNSLWTRESGWRTTAKNPSSGAYGIPQALPASKMASAGSDWRTNPATQIKWGLGYIAGRYGSPIGAWAHSQKTGWYGNGGIIPEPVVGVGLRSGNSYGFGERGPEAVVPLNGKTGGRPVRIVLNLSEDLRYYVEGIIDDKDEFQAGIARMSR